MWQIQFHVCIQKLHSYNSERINKIDPRLTNVMLETKRMRSSSEHCVVVGGALNQLLLPLQPVTRVQEDFVPPADIPQRHVHSSRLKIRRESTERLLQPHPAPSRPRRRLPPPDRSFLTTNTLIFTIIIARITNTIVIIIIIIIITHSHGSARVL